jgi:RecJ-like exonuclease
LQKVVIIDHHQTDGIEKFQINPLNFGVDGGEEISAAGVAYCVFREHPELAIVGAHGDMQLPLKGLNKLILEEGVKNGEIEIENDLKLYGRYSRPLPQFLAYSDEPLLPDIAFSEEKATEFLLQNGIKVENENGVKRTYSQLNDTEKKKLIDKLSHLVGRKQKIVGENYVFPKRPMSECLDASGFSTLLNACGRHSKEEIGIRICLDLDTDAYKEAEVLLANHRRMLREGVVFVSANLQDLGKFYFADGRNLIDEGVIGIVCGMCIGKKNDKPIIGIANGENNTIKVSSRASKKLVENGINLGSILNEVCREIRDGAIGGGHRMAAGASIPKDKINEFLIHLGDKIGEVK